MIKKRVKHHLETSPTETFRVVEEGAEVEEQQDTLEVPTNPRIGADVRASMMTTASGMPHKQLTLVEGLQLRLKRLGGRLTIVETAIMSHRRDHIIEIPLPTTPEISMTERGLGVPAPEKIDIGETEAMKDIITEEIIMMKVEIMAEIMVLVQAEGSIVQSEETEGTKAPDKGQIQGLDI